MPYALCRNPKPETRNPNPNRRFERVEDEREASSRVADEKYVDDTKSKEYQDETYYSDGNSDDDEVGSNDN